MSPPIRFPLGRIVATPAALDLLARHQRAPLEFIARHAHADWGQLNAEDVRANESALRHGERLLSSYAVGDETLWLITEADRSATTLLLPADY